VGSAVSEIGFGGVKTDSAGADWVAKLERTRFGGIIGRFGCQSIGSGCSGSTITADNCAVWGASLWVWWS
jgi:hypothetical protein